MINQRKPIPQTILLVDDDADCRLLTRQALESALPDVCVIEGDAEVRGDAMKAVRTWTMRARSTTRLKTAPALFLLSWEATIYTICRKLPSLVISIPS